MSIENIVLIAYQIFKNILNLLGQGVAESQRKLLSQIISSGYVLSQKDWTAYSS